MYGSLSAIFVQFIRVQFILLFQTIADTGQRYRYAHIGEQKIFGTERYAIVNTNILQCRRFVDVIFEITEQ